MAVRSANRVAIAGWRIGRRNNGRFLWSWLAGLKGVSSAAAIRNRIAFAMCTPSHKILRRSPLVFAPTNSIDFADGRSGTGMKPSALRASRSTARRRWRHGDPLLLARVFRKHCTVGFRPVLALRLSSLLLGGSKNGFLAGEFESSKINQRADIYIFPIF